MNRDNLEVQAELRIGFIGAGRMAQALVSGIASSDMAVHTIYFVDPHDEAANKFQQLNPRAIRCETASEIAALSNLLLLAVKPQTMPTVLQELASTIGKAHLVVSVAAGIPIRQFESELGTSRIVRVMPNTPCLIGQGMSALACHAAVADADQQLVATMLESVGQVVLVQEEDMDAVTGLSGSGPAYVFTFIEALIEGGVQQGLSAETARQLTLQTLLGAVSLVDITGQSPETLRQQVTSPGGTTLAGLDALQQNGFAKAVRQAVEAATNRSRELSQGL